MCDTLENYQNSKYLPTLCYTTRTMYIKINKTLIK